jgi:hypothetical protein
MQYALMIYARPGADEGLSDAEREAVRAEYLAMEQDARCVRGDGGEGRRRSPAGLDASVTSPTRWPRA